MVESIIPLDPSLRIVTGGLMRLAGIGHRMPSSRTEQSQQEAWRMKVRLALLALAVVACVRTAGAQQQTGEVFGKVVDQSGGVLPGVTVTLSGPTLLQPLTAVTGESGSFQFARVEIGVYSVRFELSGFKTVVHEDVRVTVGFSAQVTAQMSVSSVQETIT